MAQAYKIWFNWHDPSGVTYKVTVVNDRTESFNGSDLIWGKIDDSTSNVPVITNIEITGNDSDKPHTFDFAKLFASEPMAICFYSNLT